MVHEAAAAGGGGGKGVMDKVAKPYHHGDLKQALLTEAERILESEGIQALTMRAVARAVGVSHTAPRNHFDDLTGLLSELAAAGYRRFAMMISEGAEAGGANSRAPLRAMGRGYVRFAARHPGLFTLMFRSEQLDSNRPALRDAIAGSREALRKAVASRMAEGAVTSPLAQAAQATAAWAVVHGFAVLMLENRLKTTLASLPGTDAETLLEAMMDSLAFARGE